MPLNQQAKKGIRVLAGVTDPDYQKETGILLYNGDKEEYVWNIGDPLWQLLVLPSPVIKVNVKLYQPKPGRTTSGKDPSRKKL